jgi:hypothetical protein
MGSRTLPAASPQTPIRSIFLFLYTGWSEGRVEIPHSQVKGGATWYPNTSHFGERII